MEWISVKDRLPEKSGEVVIMTLSIITGKVLTITNVAYSAKWKAFNAYDEDSKDFVQKTEIHADYWMPMPEPPEVKHE